MPKVIISSKVKISANSIRGCYQNNKGKSKNSNLLQNKPQNTEEKQEEETQKEGKQAHKETQEPKETGAKYKYNPYLNKNAKRSIKTTVANYVAVNTHVYEGNEDKLSLYMYTLTLPSPTTDTPKEIKRKALNLFLTKLRKDFGLEIYIWVQEFQKNGNLHFHLITNISFKYVIISELQDNIYLDKFDSFGKAHDFLEVKNTFLGWNIYKDGEKNTRKWVKGKDSAERFCNENTGYKAKRASNNGKVFIANEVVRLWNETLNTGGYMEDFFQANKHKNPPSVNVKKIDNPEKAGKYITKYITKSGCKNANESISTTENGRLWGMSEKMKAYDEVELNLQSSIDENINDIARPLVFQAIESVIEEKSKFWVQNQYGFFAAANFGAEQIIVEELARVIMFRLSNIP